jgi:protocatechuate 3,4-dioxygenase beta subunit
VDLVQPAGRGSWRPAHFHVIVSAPGHRTLVTELFDADDPYLDRDAVFGVRAALIGRYVNEHDPAAAQRLGVAGPEVPVMRMDFRLAPA